MTKKIAIVYFPILMVYSTLLSAQKKLPQSGLEVNMAELEKKEGVSIGDFVPEIKFQMLNYSSSTAKLSDFKGKMVILDFWATWCSSCVANFPKLESLQTSFKEKVQVLLVNSTVTEGKNFNKIEEFLRKRREKGNVIKLPSAIEDSIAVKLFPHKEVPHYVWISPEGVVRAITGIEEVTKDNILKILNGETVDFRPKKDFYLDRIFGIGEIPIDESMMYFFFKKGRFTGVRYINNSRVKYTGNERMIIGKAVYNKTLVEIYETAINSLTDNFSKSFNKKRMIIKVLDSTDLFYDSTRFSKDTWDKDNLYTCDVVVQPSEANNLRDILLNYLNMSSDYYGRIEKMKVKCLTIVDIPDFAKEPNEKGVKIQKRTGGTKRVLAGITIKTAVTDLNNYMNSMPLVIDSTKARGIVNLKFDITIPDLNDLKRQLNKQGFDFMEEEKELDMFILSDKLPKK